MTDQETFPTFANEQTRRALWALAFATLFVVLGTLIPALYYQHAATDRVFEVHDFEVEDPVTTNDTELRVTFIRSAVSTLPAEVNLDLERTDGPVRERVTSYQRHVVYERGTTELLLTYQLPRPLEPGTYELSAVAHVEFPHGATRTIAWKSPPFVVTQNTTDTPT